MTSPENNTMEQPGSTLSPALSVVIATLDNYDAIRKTISHLRKQSVRERLEIVIIAPSRDQLALETTDLEPFASYQVIEVGPINSIGSANAAGIRKARAPIVALAEDHCFPEPEWATALLEAHREHWAAVGPGVRNANPDTAVSWADLFIGYGPWLLPTPGREVDFLPGHNTSYKRDILVAYGDALDSMMEAETLLHWDLRSKGYRLRLEPAAVVAHTNFSLWRSWLPVQYYNGRMFAGSRILGMPAWKRIVYVAGSPLIPMVRFARIARSIRSGDLLKTFAASLHALAIGLALDGAGQMVGYAFGAGHARARVAEYEFRRIDHVTETDRRRVFQAGD